MTLDTYTHLFEAARHGADVRAELARSDFANLLTPLSCGIVDLVDANGAVPCVITWSPSRPSPV